MAEEKEIATPVAEKKTGNPEYEAQGSASAPRPGDRKYGNHRGKPSERRGGRGGAHRRPVDDEYQDRVVNLNRISKTNKGGKTMRFDALVVVGDGKGKYGYALRKSGEVPDAIKKALTAAKKEIHTVKIVKGTISHDTEGVYGSTKVVLKPAPAGTGIVAGGAVRAVVELAGIKNVVAKVYGSRTAINVIRATDAGLQGLKEYEKVMILRGLKTPEELRAHGKRSKEAPAEGEK